MMVARLTMPFHVSLRRAQCVVPFARLAPWQRSQTLQSCEPQTPGLASIQVALSVALKMLSRCKDVFVHISAVLHDGQAIEYEEVANKGKTSAENLKVR